MPLLDFIRYFAVTDESPIGLAALEYCKAMVRLAPVRVASVSGGLVGPWEDMAELQLTPMAGAYVSAVCTHPGQWRQQLAVPMYKAEIDPSEPTTMADLNAKRTAHGPDALVSAKPDGFAHGHVSLYTEGVRNVLFVVPIVAPFIEWKNNLDELARYEAIVFNAEMPDLWRMLPSKHPALMQVVGTPVLPDRRISIRHAILGNVATGGFYR